MYLLHGVALSKILSYTPLSPSCRRETWLSVKSSITIVLKRKFLIFCPRQPVLYLFENRKDLDSHLLGWRGEIITLALVYVAEPHAGEPYWCAVLLHFYFWNCQYIEGQNHSPAAEIKSTFLRPFP